MRLANSSRRRHRLGCERLEDRSVPSGVEVASGDPKDWPMYNHDPEGTRHNTAETRLRPDNVGQLGIKWSYPTDGPIAGTPAVVNDKVYVADAKGVVYSLDRDGNLRWRRALDIGPTVTDVKVSSSALVTNRTVVIGDQSGRVHGLDADTGAVKWTTVPNPHPFAAVYGSATMVGQYVAIGTSSNEWLVAPFLPPDYEFTFRGSLALLDPADGRIVWQTFTISDAEHAAGATGAPIWSTPTYDRATKTIYATTGNNYTQPTTSTSDAFMAMDAATGAVKWVNQRTAGDEWTLRFGDSTPDHPDFDIGDSPQVYNLGGRTVVGAGQKSGFFHVLDAATGEEISDPLQVAPPGTVGGLFADSAYAGGVNYTNGSDYPGVFAGLPPNKGIVAAVTADGSQELWRFETPGSPNISGVAVANGVVYFQSTLNGTLFALDAKTGQPLAQVVTGSVTSGPAISRGQVYLGTGDSAFVYLTGQPLAPATIIALGITDPPLPAGRAAAQRLSVSDAQATVGADGWVTLTFEVRLSAPVDRAVSVRYATADGTARAGSDYRRAAGVVRFAAGERVKTITVRVRGDRLSGDAEFFRLKLTRPTGVTLDDAEGVGTLVRRQAR